MTLRKRSGPFTRFQMVTESDLLFEIAAQIACWTGKWLLLCIVRISSRALRVLASTAVSLLPVGALGPGAAGAECSKAAGQTSSGNESFDCRKSGGRLVWVFSKTESKVAQETVTATHPETAAVAGLTWTNYSITAT
jgi:hypothetical protein